MAEKRKDNKGRNLFTGESQRKDGSYMFRCSDDYGKRHTVYASTLKELRAKEKELQKDIADGLSISDGNIIVAELLDIYFNTNKKWRISTQQLKKAIINKIKAYPIATMRISQVKPSHVKGFCLELSSIGFKYGTIKLYCGVLHSAFDKAEQDDWIRKNPCNFKMDFIPKDNNDKKILSAEQEQKFLNFVKGTKHIDWYYDIFVLMLETGLRLGEVLGLTLSDINLQQRKISVNKQLCEYMNEHKKTTFHIGEMKTETSKRDIYISDKAYQSLIRLIARRKKETPVETIIDNHTGFLLVSHKQSKIVTRSMVEYNLSRAVQLYNQSHKDTLPMITPHSLRHTFCTRMIERGIDIKTLQYTMGHSNSKTTLDVYTHLSSEIAMMKMKKAIDG